MMNQPFFRKALLGIVSLFVLFLVFTPMGRSETKATEPGQVQNPPASKVPRTIDEMVGTMEKQMDSFMKMPFHQDPSLNNLRGFDLFDKNINDRFERMFKGLGLNGSFGTGLSLQSRLKGDQINSNVTEKDGNLIVTVDLPGHDKKTIDLKIKDNALVISSERRSQSTASDDKSKVYRSEIAFGSVSRIIDLPRKILEDKAVAKFENGVLTITAPIDTTKPEATDGRRIEIQ